VLAGNVIFLRESVIGEEKIQNTKYKIQKIKDKRQKTKEKTLIPLYRFSVDCRL
jgi:hypothetical protein